MPTFIFRSFNEVTKSKETVKPAFMNDMPWMIMDNNVNMFMYACQRTEHWKIDYLSDPLKGEKNRAVFTCNVTTREVHNLKLSSAFLIIHVIMGIGRIYQGSTYVSSLLSLPALVIFSQQGKHFTGPTEVPHPVSGVFSYGFSQTDPANKWS